MSRLRTFFETACTGILTVAALLMVGIRLLDSRQTSGTPRIVDDWARANEEGIWTGSREAPAVITEFVDFQCPFCRGAVPVLDSIAEEYGRDAAIVYIHLPLTTIHPQAIPAAIAVECADRQGRASDMIKEVFAGQDSLGTREWRTYAQAAGLPQPDEFDRCVTLGNNILGTTEDGG